MSENMSHVNDEEESFIDPHPSPSLTTDFDCDEDDYQQLFEYMTGNGEEIEGINYTLLHYILKTLKLFQLFKYLQIILLVMTQMDLYSP